jgi:acylphosphatase
MSEDAVRVRAVVRGRVQGVSFRAWTQAQAISLGIAGWVRNCADGSVEAVAEGHPKLIERFVLELKKGPPLARVDAVEEETSTATGEFSRFLIIR